MGPGRRRGRQNSADNRLRKKVTRTVRKRESHVMEFVSFAEWVAAVECLATDKHGRVNARESSHNGDVRWRKLSDRCTQLSVSTTGSYGELIMRRVWSTVPYGLCGRTELVAVECAAQEAPFGGCRRIYRSAQTNYAVHRFSAILRKISTAKNKPVKPLLHTIPTDKTILNQVLVKEEE